MKKETFATKTKSELEKILADKREALRKFRFSNTGGKITNVKEGKSLRQEIARALTQLTKLDASTK